MPYFHKNEKCKEIINKSVLGAFGILSYIKGASAAVDTNITDGITMSGTLVNTVIGVWLTPPLAYVLGLTFFGIAGGIVVSWIKGRRKR